MRPCATEQIKCILPPLIDYSAIHCNTFDNVVNSTQFTIACIEIQIWWQSFEQIRNAKKKNYREIDSYFYTMNHSIHLAVHTMSIYVFFHCKIAQQQWKSMDCNLDAVLKYKYRSMLASNSQISVDYFGDLDSVEAIVQTLNCQQGECRTHLKSKDTKFDQTPTKLVETLTFQPEIG